MVEGMERRGTAAQISTYPMDVRHAEFLVPHWIRVWGPQVDSIVVTIDTHQARSGRYRGNNFNESLERLRQIYREAGRTCAKLRVVDVDYSGEMRRAVARYFFGTDHIPIKAWDGGPFYAYFYGMYIAHAQYVMHFDGDMLFGGGSKTWMQDAIACMADRPEVLVTATHPGPPRLDGAIFGHLEAELRPKPEPLPYPAYRHKDVSTRAFMIDLNRFKSRLGGFPDFPTSSRQRLKAKLLGNEPQAREAEVVLSKTLQTTELCRIDLLGQSPGLWSLHPPYRSELFYRDLPKIVAAVEAGEVPEGQRGHYDLNDSMVDWSEARAANVWHRRYLKMIRHRLSA